MSHEKNYEAPTDNGKNELFSFCGNMSELMMAHANMKHKCKKHFKEMAFIKSHASLYHIIHSRVKPLKKTAVSDNPLLKSKKYDQIYLHVPQGGPGKAVDIQKDKDTSKPVYSKHLSVPETKSVISKKQQKYLKERSRMLPYLVLISRCIPLPIADIESKCLKGQILCRIQYFTLRLGKKKLLPQPARAKLSIPRSEGTQATYVTFDSLRDLQWKLYKGLAKRKPKVTGSWRESSFSIGLLTSLSGSHEEYILPLIPKDWIIDDSLKYKVPLPISANIYQYQRPTVREWVAVKDILGAVLSNCMDFSQSWEEIPETSFLTGDL